MDAAEEAAKGMPKENALIWHPRRPLHMEMNLQSRRGSFYTRGPGFHNFRVTKSVQTSLKVLLGLGSK